MVQLTFDTDAGLFVCRANGHDNIYPRTAFFNYDGENKHWFTKSPKVAARLRQWADGEAEKEIEARTIIVRPWSGRIVHPQRQVPKEWQLRAAKWAIERNRSYLGLDPRLGKTIAAAMVINTLSCNAVWIVPAGLTETTRDTVVNWLCNGLTVGKFEFPGKNNVNVLLVPDSQLEKRTTAEAIRSFMCLSQMGNRKVILISDEAHRFKNIKTKRAKAFFYDIAPEFEKIVLMSGSPMPNRPEELWTTIKELAWDVINFMPEFRFKMRYCGPEKVQFTKRGGEVVNRWNFNGASNMAELGRLVKKDFMLRIKRKDVKLPPTIEEAVIIDDKLTGFVARMDRELLFDLSPKDLMKAQATNPQVAAYRKELGLLKVPHAVRFIKDVLDNTDEKLLVVAWHKEVIAQISSELEDCLTITGSTPTDRRHEIQKKFLNDLHRRVLVINEQAGGLGFDFSSADRVIFVEFSWVPGDNDQAADRTFHLNKAANNESVFAQYLVFKDSKDREILEANFKKREAQAHV